MVDIPKGGSMTDMKDISQEEVSKLTRAMKDPTFQSHMDEYAKEISDPAHRREYLQYLDQLEAKGEMPEGQCLLRTEPGCCVKTTIQFKNGQTQKCFINIVYSDQLKDMSEERDSTGGKQVQMPYSLGPPRPERDNKDENCMTCDFAVGTWTFGQAIQRPQILKMLVDTASDGLAQQFLKGHEEVKKDFKVMRRIKCRGPGARPLPMSVKAELLKDKGKKEQSSYSLSVAQQSAVTPSELKEMRREAKEKQLKPPKPSNDDDEEDVPTKKPVMEEPALTKDGAPRIRVPKHKLIHSGSYDFTDFMEASNRPQVQAQSIPRLLKLIVELPTVKRSSDVSLDVTSDNICIEVSGKYYLDLPLSYEIDEEKGDAKFDKEKQILTLTLPVKPKAPDPNMLRRGFQSQEEGAEDEDAKSEGALSEGEGEEDLPPLEDPVPPPPVQPAAPDPKPSSSSSPSRPCEVTKAEPEPREEDLVPEEELDRFIQSDTYTGRRQGYYFGRGDRGLGYYRDFKQRRPVRDGVVLEAKAEDSSIAVEEERIEPGSDDPLIEEVEDGDFEFVSADAAPKSPEQKVQLSRRAQQYVDSSTLLASYVPATEIEGSIVDAEPSLDCQQSRQNLVLLVGVSTGHEVAGLQLSFLGRRLTITFCSRAVGEERWHRYQVRRTLCRPVDVRQWHAEAPKLQGAQARLCIVLRKAEQGERWPEVFDTSAAAVAANREPVQILDPRDAEPMIQLSADPTAAADTAAGTDVDVIEDSAELDIAAPAGVPVALGAQHAIATKDSAAPAGPTAPYSKSAETAAAQSAKVMGQAVLLRTRLMYQLF